MKKQVIDIGPYLIKPKQIEFSMGCFVNLKLIHETDQQLLSMIVSTKVPQAKTFVFLPINEFDCDQLLSMGLHQV